MQGITDTIKDLSSAASDKLGEAGDYLKANPTIAAMLAAGGGAGLLGGYLTSREPEDEDESKTSRRLRILRNALLSAGAGAGAVGLGAYGLDRLTNAIPAGAPNPVQEKFQSPFFRGVGSLAGGILGARAGSGMDMADLRSQALASFNKNNVPKDLARLSTADLITQAKTHNNFNPTPSGFINVPNIDRTLLNDDLKSFIESKLKGNVGQKLNKLVGEKRIDKLVGSTSKNIAGGTDNLLKALRFIAGHRAGQLGLLGAAGGLAIPEIAGEVKDLAVGNY